jgi:hypothetical protein
MTYFFIDDDQFTAHLLTSDSVALTPEQIDWAVDLSQHAATEAEQWQTYLNTLALQGVQEWLHKRSPELSLKSNWLPGFIRPPIHSSQASHLSQFVSRLEIGDFKLYLVTSDCIDDPMVAVPQAIVEQRSFEPDLYMLVEVLEELAQVRITGYLPQSQLNGQLSSLQTEDQSVLLPLSEFIPDSDKLLLHLRCANPTHFHDSSAVTPSSGSAPLNSLTSPIFPPIPSPSSTPSNFSTAALNAGLWLRNQLDRVAEEFSWILLPPLNLSGAMMSLRSGRSPIEDLDNVVMELRRDCAVEIAPDARAAYRDLYVDAVAVRLYALTWDVPAPTEPEWSLLLVLGAQPGTQLPHGISLTIQDDTQILTQETLQQAPYLYAQVIGTWNEQFRITLALPNGASLTLPPFAFHPDSV